MKKNLLFIATFLLTSMTSFGQVTFTDDFESYYVGDFVGVVSPLWTTWSGATGGAEDMQVVNDNAASGTQSCFFAGTSAQGGPQDVVLPFGGVYDNGQFDFSMNIFIDTVSIGAYFNFQAVEPVGTTWATEVFMNDDGTLEVNTGTGGAVVLTSTYEKGEWMEIAYSVDITANVWTVSINGDELGSFEALNNSIASLDIFPLGTGSNFWIDDVSFTYNDFVNTDDLINANAIKAFPNPFGDELNLNINLDETADITTELYNVSGQLLHTQEHGAMSGESTVSIATGDLAEGFYQLNVMVGSQIIVKKVVLTR